MAARLEGFVATNIEYPSVRRRRLVSGLPRQPPPTRAKRAKRTATLRPSTSDRPPNVTPLQSSADPERPSRSIGSSGSADPIASNGPPAGRHDRPVVVTGATGFIGQRLVTELVSRGRPVRAISRASTTWPSPAPDQAVRWPLPPAAAQPQGWGPLVDGAAAVIHLAAIAHQPLDDGNPSTRRAGRRALREVNVRMTLALARAAARAGVGTFVFVSSIKAVGDSGPDRRALAEDDEPSPADCYGLAKLAAERQLERLAATTSMDIVIIRPPLVFGPGVKANFARLVALAGWSARGLPLPLASIRNRRSLVHVDNLVSALARILETAPLPAPLPGRHARLYHVADEPALSTPDLLQRLAATTKRRAWLLPFPPSGLAALGRLTGRQAELARLTGSLAVDGGRFRRDFDWTPPLSMDQALARSTRAAQ